MSFSPGPASRSDLVKGRMMAEKRKPKASKGTSNGKTKPKQSRKASAASTNVEGDLPGDRQRLETSATKHGRTEWTLAILNFATAPYLSPGPGRNHPPEWGRKLACDIDRCITEYDAMGRFRQKVRQWAGEEADRYRAKQQDQFLLTNRPATLAEKYARLATIHDTALLPFEKVAPWGWDEEFPRLPSFSEYKADPDKALRAMAYHALARVSTGPFSGDEQTYRVFLADVEADLKSNHKRVRKVCKAIGLIIGLIAMLATILGALGTWYFGILDRWFLRGR